MPAPLDYLNTLAPAQPAPGGTMLGGGPPPSISDGSPSAGSVPQNILNAILPSGPPQSPVGLQPPGSGPAGESGKWGVVEQQDGTILLHAKNPDGSLGPVVQIIAPKQPKGAGAGPQGQIG